MKSFILSVLLVFSSHFASAMNEEPKIDFEKLGDFQPIPLDSIRLIFFNVGWVSAPTLRLVSNTFFSLMNSMTSAWFSCLTYYEDGIFFARDSQSMFHVSKNKRTLSKLTLDKNDPSFKKIYKSKKNYKIFHIDENFIFTWSRKKETILIVELLDGEKIDEKFPLQLKGLYKPCIAYSHIFASNAGGYLFKIEPKTLQIKIEPSFLENGEAFLLQCISNQLILGTEDRLSLVTEDLRIIDPNWNLNDRKSTGILQIGSTYYFIYADGSIEIRNADLAESEWIGIEDGAQAFVQKNFKKYLALNGKLYLSNSKLSNFGLEVYEPHTKTTTHNMEYFKGLHIRPHVLIAVGSHVFVISMIGEVSEELHLDVLNADDRVIQRINLGSYYDLKDACLFGKTLVILMMKRVEDGKLKEQALFLDVSGFL